ncbi:hypothetical protein GCM10018952_36950 [Streptosporangium vulgare]
MLDAGELTIDGGIADPGDADLPESFSAALSPAGGCRALRLPDGVSSGDRPESHFSPPLFLFPSPTPLPPPPAL